MAKRTNSVVLSSQSSERGLLSFLLARLHQLDADVIVGHNIAGFDLDVLLHRLQANKAGPPPGAQPLGGRPRHAIHAHSAPRCLELNGTTVCGPAWRG